MRSRRRTNLPSRIAIGLASVAATLGVARVASAQNVTLAFSTSQPNPLWLDNTGALLGTQPPRGAAFNPYGVNFADCESDYQLQFPISVTIAAQQSGSDTLQVWAGTGDCTQSANRAGGSGSTGTCIPVSGQTILTQLQTYNINIWARDLAAAIGASSPSGSGVLENFTSAHGTDAPCFRQSGSAAVTLSLAFLAFTNGGSTVDTDIVYNVPLATGTTGTNGYTIDLVGPIAPSAGTTPIGIGDTELILSWNPASDSDTQGFQLFCDPYPGTPADAAPAIDAQCSNATFVSGDDSSTTGDDSSISARIITDDAAGDDASEAGLDADLDSSVDLDATSTTGTCPAIDFDAAACGNSPLVNANGKNGSQIPPYYKCGAGLASPTSTTYTSTQLTDGMEYTFAVAGYDTSQNIGAVFVLGCAAPEPIRDFWTTYRQDGGGAGGAFCALDNVGAPVSSSLLCVGFGITAFTFVRRRRSRRR